MLQGRIGAQDHAQKREADDQKGRGGEKQLVGQARGHERAAVEHVVRDDARRKKGHQPRERPSHQGTQPLAQRSAFTGELLPDPSESLILRGQSTPVGDRRDHWRRGVVRDGHRR